MPAVLCVVCVLTPLTVTRDENEILATKNETNLGKVTKEKMNLIALSFAVKWFIQSLWIKHLFSLEKYFVKTAFNKWKFSCFFTEILRRNRACTVNKWKIYLLSLKFFPSNHLFSDLFSKCVAFTKLLPKKAWEWE